MHFSSHFSQAKLVPSIKIGDCPISLSKKTHSFFKTHINNICRSALRSIHHIAKIRNLLSRCTKENLIHAFISSKLDY